MKTPLILCLILGLVAPPLFGARAEKVAPWDHEPITLEGIDAAGVAALVKNPTKKVRLINVWATWCVPCVEEFPDLVKLSQKLKGREFEVITISMDHPRREQAKALKFLQDQNAGMPASLVPTLKAENRTTNNYIYSQLAQDPLMQALDPEWPGPIPHTVLVAPGGGIIWRVNGQFDPVTLEKRIMDALGAGKR